MLTNYLKLAFRNLLKHRSYSLINILGLAIGMAGCLLISLYVLDELSYDRFHERADRLYRATLMTSRGKLAVTPSIVGPLFQREFPPNSPFEFTFLDREFEALNHSEQRAGQLLNVFAALAIFVACLGLLGLASFTAEQRTKEIGVRKVLGASVANIVGLLSEDFLKLVLFAFVLALPIAWLAMNHWLQNFAYRIEISPWVFALSGSLALIIALLTVSTQAIKAALTNPVESLRYE